MNSLRLKINLYFRPDLFSAIIKKTRNKAVANYERGAYYD